MGYLAAEEERPPVLVEEVRYYLLTGDDDDARVHSLPIYRRRRVLQPQAIVAPIVVLLSCLLLVTAVFLLWPSQPEVVLEQWMLDGISIETREEGRSIIPVVYLNIKLDVVLRIRNPNFVGIYYDFVSVGVLYRGWHIGDVKLQGGHIPARRTVHVPAILDLEAREILVNAVELLIDVHRRQVPLTTKVKIVGAVDFHAIRPHLDVSVACDIVVDPKTKKVIREDCGLEL